MLLALHRIGPYHHARLQAASRLVNLHVLETRPLSLEYPWIFHEQGSYTIHRLNGHFQPEEDPPIPILDAQLVTLFASLKPGVIATVGYHETAYQRIMLAAQRLKIPLVLITDSREQDMPRSVFKEWIKRQLLRAYSSSLVSGSESRLYLQGLGLPPSAIFQPWDVVDNDFFACQANHYHSQLDRFTNLDQHFLCVSRFVPKKNHALLITAYANYQRKGGLWGLRLVGSGPLQPEIISSISLLPNPIRVEVFPFLQLQALAKIYSQASAFVLASHSDQWGLVVNEAMAAGLPCLVSNGCGCRADLIQHGHTGWCFDPSNPEELSDLMLEAEHQSTQDRVAMIIAGRHRLEAFSTEAFGMALAQSVSHALSSPRRSFRAALTAKMISQF